MRTASYFHASLKPIGRSDKRGNRSVVACAAYRTGAKLEDHYYGVVRDFSRKKDVVTSFTLAPDGAPEWASDVEQLWNAVEKKENRKNSQLAVEWEIAAPNELSDAERETLARTLGGWLVDEYGVAVTVGIHNGGTRGNGLNDHFHILMTTREITADGWAKHKLRDFNVRPGTPNPEIDRVREHIAECINAALEDAGSDERVDHRSYQARGIDREPTTHLGPKAWAMEQREGSDRGDLNREIIEARLAWQAELHSQPASADITPELEREFTGRFEGWQPLARGVDAALAAPLQHGDAGQPAPALAHGTPADTSAAASGWRRFADRVRAFQAKALELWHDESSGAPDGERSWLERVAQPVRHLISGLRHRDGLEAAKGIEEGAELAAEDTGIIGKWTRYVTGRTDADRSSRKDPFAEDWKPPPSFAQTSAAMDNARGKTAGRPEPNIEPSPDAAPDGPEPGALDMEP